MFKKMHAVAHQVNQVVIGKEQQVKLALACLLTACAGLPSRRSRRKQARNLVYSYR